MKRCSGSSSSSGSGSESKRKMRRRTQLITVAENDATMRDANEKERIGTDLIGNNECMIAP